jgi:hypothetical protein
MQALCTRSNSKDRDCLLISHQASSGGIISDLESVGPYPCYRLLNATTSTLQTPYKQHSLLSKLRMKASNFT